MDQERKRGRAARVRRAVRGAILLGLGLLLVACDTTAFIAPVNRPLVSVQAPGFTTADTCTAQQSDERVTLRFIGLDAVDNVFVNGDRIGIGDDRDIVELGRNFTYESVRFASARLYPSPDVPCTSSADCAAAGFDAFSCLPVNPGEAAAGVPNACALSIPPEESIPIVQQDPEYRGAEGVRVHPQIMAVALANGSTIHGYRPDGQGGVVTAARPDPQIFRVTMIRTGLRAFLRTGGTAPAAGGLSARNLSDGYLRGSEICLVRFRGEEFTEPEYVPNREECFFRFPDNQTIDGAISRLEGERLIRFEESVQQPVQGGRNVWYTASVLLERLEERRSNFQLPSGATAPPGVHLVLFVDGPADPQPSFDSPQTAESVAQRAQELGIEIHFIHLDRPYNHANPEAPRPFTGPIDEYANVACATGGTYQYSREPSSVEEQFRRIGAVMARSYEVEFNLSGVLQRNDVPTGRYSVSGTLQLRIASSSAVSQIGGSETGRDFRFTVFKRPVGATPAPPTIPGTGPTNGDGDGDGGNGDGGNGDGGNGDGGNGDGGNGDGGNGDGGNGDGGNGDGGNGDGGNGDGGGNGE